jgi:hypothetical protein
MKTTCFVVAGDRNSKKKVMLVVLRLPERNEGKAGCGGGCLESNRRMGWIDWWLPVIL